MRHWGRRLPQGRSLPPYCGRALAPRLPPDQPPAKLTKPSPNQTRTFSEKVEAMKTMGRELKQKQGDEARAKRDAKSKRWGGIQEKMENFAAAAKAKGDAEQPRKKPKWETNFEKGTQKAFGKRMDEMRSKKAAEAATEAVKGFGNKIASKAKEAKRPSALADIKDAIGIAAAMKQSKEKGPLGELRTERKAHKFEFQEKLKEQSMKRLELNELKKRLDKEVFEEGESKESVSEQIMEREAKLDEERKEFASHTRHQDRRHLGKIPDGVDLPGKTAAKDAKKDFNDRFRGGRGNGNGPEHYGLGKRGGPPGSELTPEEKEEAYQASEQRRREYAAKRSDELWKKAEDAGFSADELSAIREELDEMLEEELATFGRKPVGGEPSFRALGGGARGHGGNRESMDVRSKRRSMEKRIKAQKADML